MIALVHALQASVAPIEEAFAEIWPDVDLIQILDESLSQDLARDGRLTPDIFDRFIALGRRARSTGADAILFTCSAFGPAIDGVVDDLAPMIVHKPNTAMIDLCVERGGTVGLVASFEPALASITAEFPSHVDVRRIYCPGALEALKAGDFERHDRLVAEAAQRHAGDCEMFALGQFSLARAADTVAAATGRPTLTTPRCAVTALRRSAGSPPLPA